MHCGLWNKDHASFFSEATLIEVGVHKSLKETFFHKNASAYICFVPDHLEIEFIWISVQCLRQFKKQTEVIISCKLILKYSKNNRKPKQAIKTFETSNGKIIKAGLL